jgi:hypothetical protein
MMPPPSTRHRRSDHTEDRDLGLAAPVATCAGRLRGTCAGSVLDGRPGEVLVDHAVLHVRTRFWR